MAKAWGSIRYAAAIVSIALLCVLAYYSLLYLVSPHPQPTNFTVPPPGTKVYVNGTNITFNPPPEGTEANYTVLTVTRDTSNLSGKAYVADSGYIITSGYDVSVPPEQAGAVDSSGADGQAGFFDLPLWIQLRFLPIALLGALATFGSAFFVVRRGRKDSDNKKNILAFIKGNPGCTAPELARGSGMNIGTVRYHIKKLEEEGRIMLEKIGKFSRIFVNSRTYDDREKLIAAHLHNESSRQIITTLMATPGISNQQLSEALDMEKSLAYRYLQRLLEDGIVTYELEGKSKLYYIDAGAKEAIIKLMPLHYQCPGLKKE